MPSLSVKMVASWLAQEMETQPKCEFRRSGWTLVSTRLVNKRKVDPKTVQDILRHSKIQTTLDLHMPGDHDEKQVAQCAFLSAIGLGSRLVH